MASGMPNVRFVGRDQELRALAAAYGAADGGEASLVVVGGDAGVGKTRLLAEFTGTLDAVVLRSGCLPLGATGLRTRSSSSRGEPPIRIGHRLGRAVIAPVTIRLRRPPSIGQTT